MVERLPLRADGLRDYRYVAMNPAMTVMFGVADLSGQTIRDNFPDEVESWYDDYDRVLDTGKSVRFERETAPQGMVLEMFVTRIAHDDDYRLIIVMRDVTSRRRAEDGLNASEERQAFLLRLGDALRAETDPEAVAMRGVEMLGAALDLDCCYIALLSLADDRADMPYQFRRNGFAPLPLTVSLADFPETIRQAADATTVLEDVATDPRLSEADKRNLMAIGLRSIVVAALRRGENNPIWALVTVSAQPRHWTKSEIALIEDVSERVWAAVERARYDLSVRASEARWKLMADAMPNLVFVADASAGELTYVNDRFTQFTGKHADSLSDLGWLQLVHPDDQASVRQAWAHSRDTHVVLDTELRLRRNDGEYRWFQVRAVPAPDTEGARLWFGALSDIQNLMEARFQAESADRAKSEFLANMSHEIRTPLNAIVGLTSLMLDFAPDPARRRQYLHTMQDSANNLSQLIDDLLEFAKLDANMVELHDAEVDLHDLLDEAVRISGVKATEKGLHIQLHDFTSKGPVIADGQRIRQIVLNLLSNAVKFTDRGSVSVFAASEPAPDGRQTLSVMVKDTGIGIAPGNLNRIFEKFHQADNTITRRFGGTGLGLAISRRLAETMGGRLDVESQLGRGSTFTLILPVRTGEAAAPSLAGQFPIGTKPLRVLLVEDNPTNTVVAENMLAGLGHTYVTAANGFQAIENWKRGAFDVVLMDLQMPDMDGITATKRIRQAERETGKAAVKIVAMTAHALTTDREQAASAGMDDFLAKPFNVKELQQKLDA